MTSGYRFSGERERDGIEINSQGNLYYICNNFFV